MIERMKKVTVFTQSRKKHQLLLSLRELGVLHISNLVQKNKEVDEMLSITNDYTLVLRQINESVGKKKRVEQLSLSDEDFQKLNSSLLAAIREKDRLTEELHLLTQERARILPFGEFRPEEVEKLKKEGLELHFYTLIPKELKKLEADSDIKYLRISYQGKLFAIVTVNQELPLTIPAAPFVMPKESLGEIEAKILLDKERLQSLNGQLAAAASYVDVYKRQMAIEEERITFERASATVDSDDDVIYISGYIPVDKAELFTAFCKENSYAYLLADPSDEDNPPTEVKNKGPIKIIKPVFDMLGLVPGYREHDISVYFLCFLTLFFAMIIGDGGYGLIFLAIAVALNIKSKKCGLMNALLYVFSIATVAWGAVTGTWFGSERILSSLPFLRAMVIPSITNFPELMGETSLHTQNMMMKFCFSIGVVQISLACVINIVTKIQKKDLSLFADLGWLIDTCLLYLLVLYLVIGESAPMRLIVAGVAAGFILVCCFGAMAPGVPFVKGLLSSLGGFFTTFLNTISCFSNIMSYIRLFAVGMASLAIAQSFNSMAAPMMHGLAIPAGIMILVIGHTINLVMGLLSVVVHGVRLNVLEFSNQLGMEWSGYKYEPFMKKVIN